MIGVFYGFLIMGLALLWLDVAGRLRVTPDRARWWRRIGIVAAAGPGLAPLLSLAAGSFVTEWPFPMIAAAYLGLFLAYAAGVNGWPGGAAGLGLRRSSYLALILLAALPSMVLLILTPFVAIAGLGLARPAVPPISGDAARPSGAMDPGDPAALIVPGDPASSRQPTDC